MSLLECDALHPSMMLIDGELTCRCLVCSRCKHHTGDSNQGHFWGFCRYKKGVREFHFCCPDDCELGNHE